jgi:ribosomal-protein-alanine N-acetyltransferase
MLETPRLRIIPLTLEQLQQYILADNSLETSLQVQESFRTISPDLQEALEQTILPNVADTSKNYLFATLWTIILKEENRIVGDLCFVGEPNADGEIEIGYGTYEGYRQRGFMTEAVGGMIGWAEKQPHVRAMIASTEKNNRASSSVLEKNNFAQSGETDTLLHWRLQLQ